VSAGHALRAEVRLFDRRLLDEDSSSEADAGEDVEAPLLHRVNPESAVVVEAALVEPSVANDAPDTRYQFERAGYFWRDPVDGIGERLVFNRIVALKDSWSKRDSLAEAPSPEPPARRPDPRPRAPKPVPRVQDPARMARVDRYTGELGVSDEHAEFLANAAEWADFFEEGLTTYDDAAGLAGWVVNELRGLVGDAGPAGLPFGGAQVGSLAALVDRGAVSRRAAKDVLARMVEKGGEPAALIESMGLAKMGDTDALNEAVASVLSAWPEKVTEYHAGKKNLIGLFVGEVMKETRGAADPKTVRAILLSRLAD
jgi:glutaminyl-tRNA synthetase